MPARPQAARAARRFVELVLAEWDLKDLADDVTVCVSELVGNACRHGGATADEATRIRLTLYQAVDRLEVEVRDAGGGTPVLRARPTATDDVEELPESGAGLHLVQALSDGWGWWLVPDGKVVSCWFVVGRSPDR